MTNNSELHLILLWQNARYKESEIVLDIRQHLDICLVYEISWSNECVASNFTRFYGCYLPKDSFKEKECGTGKFLLLVVRDNNPKYEYTETSRGTEKVNINIFNLKQKYRKWTGGGSKIHATNTIQEVNHDACLLLGLNYKDLVKFCKKKWNGKIKKLQRDLTGSYEWNSLEQFFYTLNATTDYVVLRGFEDLKQTLNSSEHGDIDIMVKDYEATCFIVGGEKHFVDKDRPHYLIKVKDKYIYIDLWDINNKYHDIKWDNNIFKTSEYYKNIMKVPDAENYLYMLIYHCLINKIKPAADYYDKIYNLFTKLNLNEKYDITQYISPFDLYFELLEKFMKEHNYDYTKPNDRSVFYSEKFVALDNIRAFLNNKYNFTDIKPIHADGISRAYNIFLSVTDEYGQKIFVKANNIKNIYKNEYIMSKYLYEIDQIHFFKPIYYRDSIYDKDVGFIGMEYVDKAKTLKDILENQKITKYQRKGMIEDIYDIFIALKKSNVVHRDIHPNNLIYYKNHLILIDFQLAVFKNSYKELDFLVDSDLIQCLGWPDYRVKQYQWDDSYSLIKVLEYIGKEGNEKLYNNVYKEIKDYVGVFTIKYIPNETVLCKSEKLQLCNITSYPIYEPHCVRKKESQLHRLWRHLKKFKF